MRVVIQRVSEASVTVDGAITGEIEAGLLVFAGFEDEDTIEDLRWTASKIVQMRIFDDANGIMNKCVLDNNGDLLLVSQFTLHASTKRGNRPSYIKAAKASVAIPLYQLFIKELQVLIMKEIQTGVFGADMKVRLLNDGPVTIVIDSKAKE